MKLVNSMLSVVTVIACLYSSVSNATIIWNEGIDGDLTFSNRDMGTLSNGIYDIIGSLDGGAAGSNSGPDEVDNLLFTAQSSWVMDIVAISGVQLVVFKYEDFVFQEAAFSPVPVSNLLAGGAGNFNFSLVPNSNSDVTNYTVRVTVGAVQQASAPSSLLLILFALFGLFYIKRN